MGVLSFLPEGEWEGLVVRKENGHMLVLNLKGTPGSLEKLKANLLEAVRLSGSGDRVLDKSIRGNGQELECRIRELNREAGLPGLGAGRPD